MARRALGGFTQERFKTRRDDWSTPDEFWQRLDTEFHFTCDAAASTRNTKCPFYFDKETNALVQDWSGHICWLNPPYGRQLSTWVRKAYAEARDHGATVVCLIPARTNTEWFHEYVMRGEIRFVRGRLQFGDAHHGLPLPLAVVIFKPGIHERSGKIGSIDACVNDRPRKILIHGRASHATIISGTP